MADTMRGDDGVTRCAWAGADPLYQAYHDQEWGFPVAQDDRLFEKICLEGFQAGLSWLTILRKRDHFRRAFRAFEPSRVARLRSRDVERLLLDPGIVRHRGKIESTINNARRALETTREHGSLATYLWRWDDPKALARDLKRRGWSFVGPTTIYAFMQACGMVNDHAEGCAIRPQAEQARARFTKPIRDLRLLLRQMAPRLNEGEWAFCAAGVDGALATFRESEGATSIVSRTRAAELGLPSPFVAAWITLEVRSDLEAVGFLAAIATALAKNGIACNVVSAFHHDHLFVPFDRRHDAMRILSRLTAHRQLTAPSSQLTGPPDPE